VKETHVVNSVKPRSFEGFTEGKKTLI